MLLRDISNIIAKSPFNPLDLAPNKTFECVLMVGDPHFTSRQISSRNDLISTSHSLLDKWTQIAEISNQKKALTLCYGDVFDNDKEHNIKLASAIGEINQQFYYTPFTNIGNHDKTETALTDNNLLKFMIDNHMFFELRDNEITIKTIIGGVQVEIGATHYGSKIPNKVKRDKATDKMIWVTHHDLMFSKAYPNMQRLHEIQGVDLAVNGHIHNTQPERQMGMTTWCNSGNISRLSRDMADFTPKVWIWTPQRHDNEITKLEGIELSYQKNIFKQAIEIAPTIENQEALITQTDYHRLQFTQAAMNYHDDNNATDDKARVLHGIRSLCSSMNVTPEFQKSIEDLLNEVE